MNLKIYRYYFSLLIFFCFGLLLSQNYPDQHYVLRIDSIYQNIEINEGCKLSDDGKHLILQDDKTSGYVILKQQFSQYPFNQGLPSWNGTAPNANSSFKVLMRFPYGGGWSPWLMVGYWKNFIWFSYDATNYPGGYVDIDYVKLYSYQNSWQFKVSMSRSSTEIKSPTIHKLSFFVSDSKTTNSVDINQIAADNPPPIFVPTNFIYQYKVDQEIGGSICSPTSVAMILKSYNIEVDPYQFAVDTYDPYFEIFGVWPRVVQNASEYGLDGAVTRYRNWSEAYEVLNKGGRISMSIGQPLYSGHLIMLAGFTNDGKPIVHDPAKSNGDSYVYNKTDLSKSWFNKGGVAYTFYPESNIVSVNKKENESIANDFKLYQNYPNPFNPSTTIEYTIPNVVSSVVSSFSLSHVTMIVYDALGREVAELVNELKQPGNYEVKFEANNLPSGIYFAVLKVNSFYKSIKMSLIK